MRRALRNPQLAPVAAVVTFVLLLVALGGGGGGGGGGGPAGPHPPGWGKPVGGLPNRPALVRTYAMWDSVSLRAVPARPFAVAGYTAGFWPTYLPMRAAFPAAHAVSVAISASYHADCLDVEPGDATPAQVSGWIVADRAAGFKKPCVYSSLWEFLHQVRPALAAAGIARGSILEWDADYTGVNHLDPGFDATQWYDKALGRNLDVTAATAAFLSIARPPFSTPRPLAVCFTRRETAAACAAARARVRYANGALNASWAALDPAVSALTTNGCRRPYRRAVCVRAGRAVAVLTHRVRYFAAVAAAVEGAN